MVTEISRRRPQIVCAGEVPEKDNFVIEEVVPGLFIIAQENERVSFHVKNGYILFPAIPNEDKYSEPIPSPAYIQSARYVFASKDNGLILLYVEKGKLHAELLQ